MFYAKPSPSVHWTVTSLFSGCGGLDLGFRGDFSFLKKRYESLPFKFLEAHDINPKCAQAYKINLGTECKITDLSKAPAESLAAADILIGGFPCQDFAMCGPRKGLTSKRGRLYKAMLNYVKHHLPYVFVAENVAGLASINRGLTLKRIVAEFTSLGYTVNSHEILAADYGIPQLRHRIFIIGTRTDLKGSLEFPPPIYSGRHKTISWAIGDLISSKAVDPNQLQYFQANRARSGHGQGDETNQADRPGYTIRANAKSRIQFHYSLPRRLTIRECARLQTFPDTFTFPFAATENIRLIGNAVPPVLAHKLAKQIKTYLSKQNYGQLALTVA